MTAPKSKKDKNNWQEAMFNEAEASNNTQWAKETRWAALFQPVRDSFALWSKADGDLASPINMVFLFILANKVLEWTYKSSPVEASGTLLGIPMGLMAIVFLAGNLFGLFNKQNLILPQLTTWFIYCSLNLFFSNKGLPFLSDLAFLMSTSVLLSTGNYLGQQLRKKLKA